VPVDGGSDQVAERLACVTFNMVCAFSAAVKMLLSRMFGANRRAEVQTRGKFPVHLSPR
jgi:Na+-driven multidrug efflux pump